MSQRASVPPMMIVEPPYPTDALLSFSLDEHRHDDGGAL